MTTGLILLSIYLAASLVMGTFSVTQLSYQHRMGIIESMGRSVLAFIKGMIAWPVLFPLGIVKNKYKVNVFHKVGNTDMNI